MTHGWGLLELRAQQMSLEDIFLQLTTEEASEGPDGIARHDAPPDAAPGGGAYPIAAEEHTNG